MIKSFVERDVIVKNLIAVNRKQASFKQLDVAMHLFQNPNLILLKIKYFIYVTSTYSLVQTISLYHLNESKNHPWVQGMK
jgi:hypothetical protein